MEVLSFKNCFICDPSKEIQTRFEQMPNDLGITDLKKTGNRFDNLKLEKIATSKIA